MEPRNNIHDIILKTINSVKKENIDYKQIITNLKKIINETFTILKEANKIDIKNNNGFDIELKTINTIIDRCLSEQVTYGSVVTSTKNEQKNYYYGKEITSIGNVCLIFDGNTYTLLELLLRNILANNNLLISYSGYMYGTNNYIVEIFKEILNKNKVDFNMINVYLSDDPYSILKYFTSIDLCIGIGPRELQNQVLKHSLSKTITSGYENFDLYIESLENIEFIKKIINQNLSINIYVKEGLSLDIEDVIYVSDIDEAISMINNTGSKYSTSIFTDSGDNADMFIREIKSHQVLVNTSPTVERILDIKQIDLSVEKNIIYPQKRNIG